MVRVAAALSLAVLCPCVLLSGCGAGSNPASNNSTNNSSIEDYVVKVFGQEDNFLWGSATAAGQVEGAWNTSGKQASIWDDFCHGISLPDTTIHSAVPLGQCGKQKDTLDVTDDFYHDFSDDIDLLANNGFNSLRLSISWPRVMPLNASDGKHHRSDEGIAFYRSVFTKMQNMGIVPMVTLFHWDLPNDLSWLRADVVEEYVAYASLVFEELGDLVQHWATFNEPHNVCHQGYGWGHFAPGHLSLTDQLVCAHHVLQAHARAVDVFRRNFQMKNQGQVGIVLDYKWPYPATDSAQDKIAAQRDTDFVLGLWADPIFKTGTWPASLKDYYGEHLPVIAEDDQKLLKHSADFFGLNTYGGNIAVWDSRTLEERERDADPADIGSFNMQEMYTHSPCYNETEKATLDDPEFECGADSPWLWAKPEAMYKYLEYVNNTYSPEKIFVTEFGFDVKDETTMQREQALKDTARQEFYRRYMYQIAKAKEDGVPIKGIYAWSLLDNLEWVDGLDFRFGLTYVDYNTLKRYPKDSAKWFKSLLSRINGSVTGANHAILI